MNQLQGKTLPLSLSRKPARCQSDFLTGTDIRGLYYSSGEYLWHQWAVLFANVCYESCHFLYVFSSSKISVIACVTESHWDGITEKHKQLYHIHQNRGREQALSHSFPFLSLCVSHLLFLACINKPSRTRTRLHQHPLTHMHADLLPRYVHDFTPMSEVYERQACCNTSLALSQLAG